ncbi:jg18258 [Pararge aegeria aegeria]|uniref:Jg18258 protein n=1 Tax=Pararge aegeria aegeria TaxID=348720 RepID=A0A8S4SEC4_9NEOP|nr:jg18258 [Pararge aegeria aegeria]
MRWSQGMLRIALLLLYIRALRVSVFHLAPCMLCAEDSPLAEPKMEQPTPTSMPSVVIIGPPVKKAQQ